MRTCLTVRPCPPPSPKSVTRRVTTYYKSQLKFVEKLMILAITIGAQHRCGLPTHLNLPMRGLLVNVKMRSSAIESMSTTYMEALLTRTPRPSRQNTCSVTKTGASSLISCNEHCQYNAPGTSSTYNSIVFSLKLFTGEVPGP